MDDALRRIWSSRLTRNAGTYAPWAMLALVFIVDLNTPLGFAVCLGYAPAVLLAIPFGLAMMTAGYFMVSGGGRRLAAPPAPSTS